VLGEELLDPHTVWRAPKFALGSDKDPGNCDTGLHAVGALFVSFAIDSSRAVMKASIGDIDMSICNQIIQHFLFHFRPDRVSKHANFLNHILGVHVCIANSSIVAATKFCKKLLCVRKINGLSPMLWTPDVVGIRKKAGHGVGHEQCLSLSTREQGKLGR